jgi:hypothetical protein
VLHPLREDTHGRLPTRILSDARAGGEGVKAKTQHASGIENTTDTNGFFDTAFQINSGGYTVDADIRSPAQSASQCATVIAGRSNYVGITRRPRQSWVCASVGTGNQGAAMRRAIDEAGWPEEKRNGSQTRTAVSRERSACGRIPSLRVCNGDATLRGRSHPGGPNQSTTTNLVLGATANCGHVPGARQRRADRRGARWHRQSGLHTHGHEWRVQCHRCSAWHLSSRRR